MTVNGPLYWVRFVPAGTPVLPEFGKPPVRGWVLLEVGVEVAVRVGSGVVGFGVAEADPVGVEVGFAVAEADTLGVEVAVGVGPGAGVGLTGRTGFLLDHQWYHGLKTQPGTR